MAPPERVLFLIALTIALFGLLFNIIGFVSPFWYQSRTDKETTFKNIGLWQACFDHFQHPADYIGKLYTGCWWIFHTEYWWMRDWLLPTWFISVQVMVTGTLVCQLVGAVLLVAYFLRCCRPQTEAFALYVSAAIQFLCGGLLAISVIVFATMSKDDRTWMPRPEYNYMSWSFGMAVISGFFSIFAGICLLICGLIVTYGPPGYPLGEKEGVARPSSHHMIPASKA